MRLAKVNASAVPKTCGAEFDGGHVGWIVDPEPFSGGRGSNEERFGDHEAGEAMCLAGVFETRAVGGGKFLALWVEQLYSDFRSIGPPFDQKADEFQRAGSPDTYVTGIIERDTMPFRDAPPFGAERGNGAAPQAPAVGIAPSLSVSPRLSN